MKHTHARTAMVLTIALVAAACSGNDDDAAPTTPPTTAAPTTTSTTTTSSTTSTTTTTTEPEPEIVLRSPLSGMPITDPSEIPDRPALAVKLDNNPRAHPQAGLNEADIVFEEIVEFGTRFAIVFHNGESDPLGPIRSGRSQDVGILSSLDRPLFAWSGGNAGVRAIIRGSDMVDLDAGFSPGYYRRSGRGGAPHNLYSSTAALWESTPEEFNLPPQQFPYLPVGDEPEGEEATLVQLTMDGLNIRWEYDEETGQYLRTERGSPHQSEGSGQVSTDNVVVMAVEYRPSEADRRSPEAQVTGAGPVVVFSGGVARVGYWIRPSIYDPFVFVDELPELDELLEEGLSLVPAEGEPADEDADTAPDAIEDDDAATTDADETTGDETTGDAGAPTAGVDPFVAWDLDVDLIGLVPGRTWVELARDAENFVTWE